MSFYYCNTIIFSVTIHRIFQKIQIRTCKPVNCRKITLQKQSVKYGCECNHFLNIIETIPYILLIIFHSLLTHYITYL